MQNPFNPVQQLLALHARGQYSEMERQARDLLRGQGSVAILNELLGIALSGQKKFAEALPYLQRAVRKEAGDPLFWQNLGLCQRELREFQHAEKSLRQALKLRPGSPEPLNALGSLLREQERHEEAQAVFEQVLELSPNHGPAHFNLGRTLLLRNDLARAEHHLRRALECGQDSAGAYRLVGRSLSEIERPADAELCFRRAIGLDPSDFINYAYLAHACFQQRRKDLVGDLLREAFGRLGDIRAKVADGRIDDLDQFARLLTDMRRYRDAMRIVEVTARSPLGDRTQRLAATIFSARYVCSWPLATEMESELMAASDSGALFPFVALPLASVTPARQYAIAKAYSAKFLTAERRVPRRSAGRSHDRLRIGYLSSDFQDHPVAFLLAGVIETHDRSRFEVIAYDHALPTSGVYRERMMHAFERFVPLHGRSCEEAMQQIADDEPDILIDLNGWTAEGWTGFLAKRVAPLQMQWLGYAGTLGAPWIDYVVADRRVIQPGDEAFYAEKVLALPDSYQPNDDKRESPQACARSETGLPEGAFVFGCFNKSYKITPEVFAVWMRLLQAKADSVLWLLDMDAVGESLRGEAASHGVDPQRLHFAPYVETTAEHLARIPHMDVALDCFPFNSHTTGADMLWMGVPLIGLKGETFASRVSESILCAAGLDDLVAASYDDYFELARRCATDAEFLAGVKARARACRTTPLFDTRRFTRNLEHGLELAWQRHVAGLSPDHIDVPQAVDGLDK